MTTETLSEAQQQQVGTIARWLAGLDALHARIAPRFRRAEVRARARRDLAGLVRGWSARTAGSSPRRRGSGCGDTTLIIRVRQAAQR